MASQSKSAMFPDAQEEYGESPNFPGAGSKSINPEDTHPKLTQAERKRLRDAWLDGTVASFKLSEKLLNSTFNQYMSDYRWVTRMYRLMFAVGMVLFIAAVIAGTVREVAIAALFGGLGVTVFLAFFISQPLRAIEENFELITWLSGNYNTYVTRLNAISDPVKGIEQLKEAGNDFHQSMKDLVEKHAALRANRSNTTNH